MVRFLLVLALLCVPVYANKDCAPRCKRGQHCLKGECVSTAPVKKSKCFSDIDCHPGFCGGDGVCHKEIDRNNSVRIESEFQIDQNVDNAARE